MVFQGFKAVDYLTDHLHDEEAVSSSHWKYFHRDFDFNNGELKGVQGFGHNSKYYGPFFNWIHFLFQSRYRKFSSNSLFFKKINKSAVKIAKSQNRSFGIDILRQTLTLDFLNENNVLNKLKNTLIIGDGFGTMTSIILENDISDRVFLINLRKTLLVDLLYIKTTLGNKRFNNDVIIINELKDLDNIDSNIKLIAIEAENYSIIKRIEKDLVINIASFQEMEMEVVNNYLKFIYEQASPFHFYICNREKKSLPDNSLISIKDYKFNDKDKVIIDELCSWHQDFYTLKPPFIKKYDGPLRHQLRKVNY